MDKYFAANAVLSIFGKSYEELKKDLPIRPSEMGVLNIITETPGLHTPMMLAEALKVSKPMITAHLTSLMNKGYITKQHSLEDKRAYYILPTEKARVLVKEAKEDLYWYLEQLANGLGEERFDLLVKLAEEATYILEECKK
ncbi:MAG: MarR family transcriptional regulator [Lachnospiraceae bacterium]|nr:MarR family transcriptional regulator [Lachnospiraceae bacterium]MBD5455116.1 MarR family transcriptional regulator [Lachnospiraceae bacterium]